MSITSYAPIANTWFYLLVVGGLIALSTYIWQFRNVPGAKMQVCLQLSKDAWLCFWVLASNSSELPDKLFWLNLKNVAAALVPYFWLLFILKISNQEKLLPPIVSYVLPAALAGLCAVVLTDPWHHLGWTQAWLEGQTFYGVEGMANVAVGVSCYTLSAITLAFSIRWIIMTSGMRRKQAWWFTLVGVFSLMGAVMRSVPDIFWLSPLPLWHLLAALFTAWGLYRWHVYNIFTLAEQSVIRNMIDGLLVVDEYGYIVEMNAAAYTICRDLPATVGSKFSELSAAWPALSSTGENIGLLSKEVERELAGESHCYQLQVAPLTIRGYILGKTLVFQDITERKQRQAQLLDQQRLAAMAQERANLARELHDDLYQVLGYLNVQSQSIMKFASDGQMSAVTSGLSRLTSVAQKAYDEVQAYIRDVQVGKMAEKGLAGALREYAGWVQESYGLKVELAIPADMDRRALEPAAELQLLRIVQEALNNVRKHAQASHIRLALNIEAAEVCISVADDGSGYPATDPPDSTGFGLSSMRERAAKVGGKLEITSAPGQGTHVVVRVPYLAG